MSSEKCIVFLALLGDPEVSVGIPGTGGFNKTVSELLCHFYDSNKRIIVITNKSRYNQCYFSRLANNVSIYRIDFESIWESNQNLIVDNIEMLINNVKNTIETVVGHSKVCLIHSFYWLSGYVAARIQEDFDIPFIHTVVSLSEDKYSVGVQPHAKKQRDFESYFLSKVKIILAITPQEVQTLNKKYSVPLTSIIVIGRSINDSFKQIYKQGKSLQTYDNTSLAINLNDDNPWWVNGAFLYVGRVVEIKGIEQIVKAWINAKEQFNLNIPLWIVGGTPKQICITRERILINYPNLVEYEKNNQIIWWGNLNSNGISTLMRKAQALIMHSRFEAGGRVIIEAFSAGIPVIATPYGFAADYIYDGYNGYIIRFNDIDHLVKTMMKFSEQPYLSSVMGDTSYKFMETICNSWNYFEEHSSIYDAFIDNRIPSLPQKRTAVPKDLHSYKRRNCVTAFPYFSTKRNLNELSKLIEDKIGCGELFEITTDFSHSYMYTYSTQDKVFYVKCFFHTLSNRLTKVLYKNTDVISAQEQASRAKMSCECKNVASVEFADISNLMYIIPEYENTINTSYYMVLHALWTEMHPDQFLIELYSQMKFNELEKIIEDEKNSLLNGLFCAEIAYKKLFFKHKLPIEIDTKIKDLMNSERASLFGLNYGKGIVGHIILNKNEYQLLPSSSIYLGELGYDVVMTYLQYSCDNIKLWELIKSLQSDISSKRMDLWFLIIVYSFEYEHKYRKTIEYILNF